MNEGRVAAVVPAFEARGMVGNVVEGLRARWPYRDAASPVIAVDDGSGDGTAEEAARAGAVVLRHRANRGKGAALRTGFAHAHSLGAVAAVTVDADGQHPAEEAARLASHPAPSGAIVLGIRDLVRDGAPRANQRSNAISNFFLSRFLGRRLHDTQCGLRRYPLPRVLELGGRDDGYAYEAELLLLAAHAGIDLVEEPVRVFYPSEEDRRTHFHVVRDPARIVYRVLATLARNRAP